jgi:hypothetical protein
MACQNERQAQREWLIFKRCAASYTDDPSAAIHLSILVYTFLDACTKTGPGYAKSKPENGTDTTTTMLFSPSKCVEKPKTARSKHQLHSLEHNSDGGPECGG